VGIRFSRKTPSSNLTATGSVITPNQWKLVDSVPFGAGAGVPISGRKLPRTGTYTLVVDPDGAQYGHVSLKLVKGTAATAALATAAAGGTAPAPGTSAPAPP